MSVFLRWGIFGILGVAALMYSYNASKRMAEKHAAKQRSVVTTPVEDASAEPASADNEGSAESESEDPTDPVMPPQCQVELRVARRARTARSQGEPLDRLLRYQDIAWAEPAKRRERLEKVAIFWFNLQGDEPTPKDLLESVLFDCQRFIRAP